MCVCVTQVTEQRCHPTRLDKGAVSRLVYHEIEKRDEILHRLCEEGEKGRTWHSKGDLAHASRATGGKASLSEKTKKKMDNSSKDRSVQRRLWVDRDRGGSRAAHVRNTALWCKKCALGFSFASPLPFRFATFDNTNVKRWVCVSHLHLRTAESGFGCSTFPVCQPRFFLGVKLSADPILSCRPLTFRMLRNTLYARALF